MLDDPTRAVFVARHERASTRAGDHAALAHTVEASLGTASGSVRIGQTCLTCGGTDHGALSATTPAGRVWVSLSRAGQLVAVAVSLAGPIGIDLAAVDAVNRAAVDAVLCTPTEAAALTDLSLVRAARARARLWTVKEAVLKADGRGLRVDPRALEVSVTTEPRLTAWSAAPVPLARVHLLPLPADAGLPVGVLGTVAVFAHGRPQLRLR